MKKSRNINTKITIMGFIFMIPAFVMILLTTIVPLIWNLVLSFCEWGGSGSMSFIGIDNYIKLFETANTNQAITHSIFIGVFATIISVVFGIILALGLYFIGGKLGGVARVVFYSPAMIPRTVLGLLFVFIFANSGNGLLNAVLGAIGLENLQHAWLSEKGVVLVVLGFLQGWCQSGTIMMLSYAAMVSIPQELYESAELEGCNTRKKIRYIILPLIKQTVRLAMSMTLVWSFRTYDLVETMTQGGPANLSMTAPIIMVKSAFSYNKYGYAAAIGIICTVLIGACILLARYIMRGETYEY